MKASRISSPGRRRFVTRLALAGGALPLLCHVANASDVIEGSGSGADRRAYQSLDPGEAAFTERLVTALCPADRLTPDGLHCGLARSVDGQIGGEFGRRCARDAWESGGAFGVELPLTQEQFFKAGIRAADEACRRRFGVPFARLTASGAEAFVRDIAAGRVTDSPVPLALWLDKVVNRMLEHACFTAPVYEQHGSRLFWKLFGPQQVPAG